MPRRNFTRRRPQYSKMHPTPRMVRILTMLVADAAAADPAPVTRSARRAGGAR